MSINDDLPLCPQRVPHVVRLHLDESTTSSTKILVVETNFPPPLNIIQARLSEAYVSSYPCGEVSYLAGDVFQVVPAGELASLEILCRRIVQTCELLQEVPQGMDGQETSSWARASSAELVTPPTACNGGFTAGLNEQFVADMEKTVGGLKFLDHPSLGLVTVTLDISLTSLSDACAEAWEVLRHEPLQISLTFDRRLYLSAPVRVDVGQERNFINRCFNGLPGQLKLVVQRFCEAHAPSQAHYLPLLAKGYLLDDILTAVGGGQTVDFAKVAKALSQLPDAQSCSQRVHPPAHIAGFFNRLIKYVELRLKTISSFCAICDHGHDVSSAMRLSVCGRDLCTFRFEELDVGKNFGFSTALQAGIVDLLVNFARAAALHTRWALIFQPFPRFSHQGRLVVTPETKESSIELVREVFKAMPPTYKFLQTGSVTQNLSKAHPMAGALFQWIISSNTSHLTKLDPQQRLEFMVTPHQYLLAMNSDDRTHAFDALKSKHGSCWAFHGSNGENWHSILRNGLKNASGTKLQVNGTAYGNGVYLSPNASTSFGYSNIANLGPAPKTAAASADATTGDFIHFESMVCITICEVVNHNIKKSGSIWVQADENCVMARYFFVYDKHAKVRGDADLQKPELQRILFERSAAS